MRLSRVCFLLIPLLVCGQAPNTETEKATVSGLVVNSASGLPLRKVRLTLRALTGRTPGMVSSAVSDVAGRFEFPKLEPANYDLRGNREGFTFAELAVKEGGKLRGPISLSSAEKKAGILVRMTPLGVITGRVTDEDGDPLRGVQVAIVNYRFGPAGRELAQGRTATSDDLGEYRIYDVAPGKFYLRASSPAIRMGVRPDEVETYAVCFYPVSSDAAGATQLEVTPGQQLREMNFALRKARFATIRGRLIAPPDASNPLVGYISPRGASSMTRSINDKEGKFELAGLPPGPIYLTGSFTAAGRRMEVLLPLQVGSEDIDGIELAPIPRVDVRGRVRIDGTSNVRLSQLALRFQSESGNSFGGGTARDDTGTFEFKEVAPSVYRLISSAGQGLYFKAMYWGEREITDTPLDLTNGAPSGATLTVVYGADGGEISGTVTDNDSKPGNPATVVLVPTGGHRSQPFYRFAMTGPTGLFGIRGVAPGDYKLFAFDQADQNQVIYDPDFLPPYETDGKTIRVQAGKKKTADLKLLVNKQGR